MKNYFVGLLIVVMSLFGGRVAIALDLLNLSTYSEGSPVSYGKNVIVMQSEVTSKKWLAHQPGAKTGSLTFTGLNVSGDIEIVVEPSYSSSYSLTLTSADGNYIQLTRYNDRDWKLYDGSDTKIGYIYGKVKLVISGYTAKLYDEDDEFEFKITLAKPFLTYNDLKVEDIYGSNDEIHQLTINAGGITAPTTDFDKGKQAGIQQCVTNPASCGIVSDGGTTTTIAAINLINISTRANIGGGVNDVIAGFIITGFGTKKVLVRGLGKGVGFAPGLNSTLKLEKYPSGELVASNDNWQSDIRASEIPAANQPPDPTDAAFMLNLPAGAYTATMGSIGTTGIGLIDVTEMQ